MEEDMGFNPEVKKYFRKIMNSFALGLLWMLAASTAGFYFKLAFIGAGWQWYNIAYYAGLALTFAALTVYLYKTWRF